MQQPTFVHWEGIKRVLKYLKETLDHGLFIPKSESLSLFGYTDADCACNLDDRKSIVHIVCFLDTHSFLGLQRNM